MCSSLCLRGAWSRLIEPAGLESEWSTVTVTVIVIELQGILILNHFDTRRANLQMCVFQASCGLTWADRARYQMVTLVYITES